MRGLNDESATVLLTAIVAGSALVLATFLNHIGLVNRLVAQSLVGAVVVAGVISHVASRPSPNRTLHVASSRATARSS